MELPSRVRLPVTAVPAFQSRLHGAPGQRCTSHGWIPSFFYSALLCFALSAFTRFAAAETSTELRDWIRTHPAVRFAPEQDYGPFIFTGADGSIGGLSWEFLELVVKRSGLDIRVLPTAPLQDILVLARQREADLVSSLRPTPERARYLSFTPPYVSVPAVLVVRDGGGDPESLLRLVGRRVAVGTGYAVESFVRERHPGVSWVGVANDAAGIRQLVSGSVDGVVADAASVRFAMAREQLTGLRIAGPVGFDYQLCFAYRSDWPALGKILEAGLLNISAQERRGLYERWVAPYDPSSRDTRHVWTERIAFAALFMAALLAAAGAMARNRRGA